MGTTFRLRQDAEPFPTFGVSVGTSSRRVVRFYQQQPRERPDPVKITDERLAEIVSASKAAKAEANRKAILAVAAASVNK